MSFEFSDIFDFSIITPKVQNHITKVYAYLLGATVISLISFISCQLAFISNIVFMISSIVSVVSNLISICLNKHSTNYKFLMSSALFGYAFSVGGILGNNLSLLGYNEKLLNYRICITAFSYTVLIFGLFSLFATITVNRPAIYGLSLITSLVLSIISIFIWNLTFLFVIEIIVVCCYVISDTQLMIKRALTEDREPIDDAYMLFIDVVKIFMKIYNYLKKKAKEEDEEKKKKKSQ